MIYNRLPLLLIIIIMYKYYFHIWKDDRLNWTTLMCPTWKASYFWQKFTILNPVSGSQHFDQKALNVGGCQICNSEKEFDRTQKDGKCSFSQKHFFKLSFLQPESRSWEEFQPKSGSWEEEKERTCPIVHQLPIQLSCCLVALSWTLMVLMPFSFVMVKIPSCWKLTWQLYMSCRVQFNACCWDSTQLNRFHSWLFDPVSNIARLALKKEKQIDVETCLLEATLKKVATSLVAASLLCPSWNTYCDSLPTFSPLFLTPWFYCNLNAQMSGWVGPDINLS